MNTGGRLNNIAGFGRNGGGDLRAMARRGGMLVPAVCLTFLVPPPRFACLTSSSTLAGGVAPGEIRAQPLPQARLPLRSRYVIPAHDEETTLAAALRSLRQDYPADGCGVYVVADDCTDLTAIVARECRGRVRRAGRTSATGGRDSSPPQGWSGC